MRGLASLVKDTAIYGLSSMLGRFLNWLMTFVYVRVLLPEDYGRMSYLYAGVALGLIILTYGMETAFFRFVSKHDRPGLVFGTTLTALGLSSGLFLLLGGLFLEDISLYLGLEGYGSIILMLMAILALDAFTSIPLGYLRFVQRPWYFMGVRLGFVALTIVLTLLTFYGVPWLSGFAPQLTAWYCPSDGLTYIFAINLLGCLAQLLALLPILRLAEPRCSLPLLKQMLIYALPLLILGLAGSFSNQADKILFPKMLGDSTEAYTQLGIYSACYKLAVVMILFTQAFRYAYDPYVFSKSKEGEQASKQAYAESLLYYTLFTLVIFVGVIATLDLLKLFITPAYYDGLIVVPFIMLGQLLFGIYYNLSLWYKLTDRTYWGAILSAVGCLLTTLIIVLGAKPYGYMACAYASVIANAVILLLSYWLGQKYYPIAYPWRKMGLYALLALGVVLAIYAVDALPLGWVGTLACKVALLLLFVALIAYREVPRSLLATLSSKIKR